MLEDKTIEALFTHSQSIMNELYRKSWTHNDITILNMLEVHQALIKRILECLP